MFHFCLIMPFKIDLILEVRIGPHEESFLVKLVFTTPANSKAYNRTAISGSGAAALGRTVPLRRMRRQQPLRSPSRSQKLCTAVDSIARTDDPRPCRDAALDARAGRACQRGRQRAAALIPLRHCMDRARIVSFWRHNPEISDILCGLNNTGVAVRDRDG